MGPPTVLSDAIEPTTRLALYPPESELRELALSQPLDEWRPPAHVYICPVTATSRERRTLAEPGHGPAYLLGSQRRARQHVCPLRAKAIQQQCEKAAPHFAVVG
jgi:hypothetical protein